jgi:hypothetical protein
MSYFDLTKTLCDDNGKMIGRFWWSQQGKENKLHWLSWELLCSRKEKGGLDYRDLHLFNLAILARQGFRFLMEPKLMCAQVLRAKYCLEGELLKAEENPGISYSRRISLEALQQLEKA